MENSLFERLLNVNAEARMKEAKENVKARILEGAAALFIERGIEKVTTRDLAEHLGISRSHVYHYFSDWQTLCIASMAHYMQGELDAFMAELAGRTPHEKLRLLIANYLPDEPDAVWQLYSSLWQLAVHNAAYAELAESVTEKWVALVAGMIEEGVAKGDFRPVDIPRTTRQLGAMLNGYAELLIIRPSPEKCRVAADDITDFIQRIL